MPCRNKNIKALLPAFLEQALDEGDQKIVQDHLAACEDCRAELTLLRVMADEPVPDPGGAFWQTMPERVFRAVQEENAKQKQSALSSQRGRPFFLRWAWATAAVGLLATVSWFLVRPAPMDVARTGLPDTEAEWGDIVPAEPVSVAELSPAELSAATQWAQNGLAPLRDAVTQDAPEAAPKDLYEDLMELSPQELDRVYEMLKKEEQDARERLRKKTVKEKALG